MKRVSIIVILLLCTGFAAYRVYPYMSSSRGQSQIAKQMQYNGIKDIKVPDGMVKLTPEEADSLHRRLVTNVNAALEHTPLEHNLSLQTQSQLAEAYADFVVLNATGALQEYLAEKQSADIDPYPLLVQEDNGRAQKAWLFSVAWARGAPLQPETIRVVPRYIRGRVVAEEPYLKTTVSPRKLRNGGWLSQDGPGNHTGYEVLMDVQAPSLDGKETYDVQLGVLVINDGLNGEWNVIETRYVGLQDEQFTTRPCP